jgi:hypothetical protein
MSTTPTSSPALTPATTRNLPEAILETVLNGLAAVFLAAVNSDADAARHAAARMLDVYRPQTEDELRLAANIIAFSFQALSALGQAAALDLPVDRALRLNASAVSLSREAAKAERRLVQLRKARQPPIQAQSSANKATTVDPQPKPEAPIAKIQEISQDIGKIATIAKANGVTWTQAYNLRQRDLRIAASIKRAEARAAQQPCHATTPPSHTEQPIPELTGAVVSPHLSEHDHAQPNGQSL